MPEMRDEGFGMGEALGIRLEKGRPFDYEDRALAALLTEWQS